MALMEISSKDPSNVSIDEEQMRELQKRKLITNMYGSVNNNIITLFLIIFDNSNNILLGSSRALQSHLEMNFPLKLSSKRVKLQQRWYKGSLGVAYADHKNIACVYPVSHGRENNSSCTILMLWAWAQHEVSFIL